MNQHRGGLAGFIKVLDPQTLAFADFTGNRQYITTGNYAEGERIKIWGRARVVPAGAELAQRLVDPSYEAHIEQAIIFDVTAWDSNCSQHIPKLVNIEHVKHTVNVLTERIASLEATLRAAGVAFTEKS